VIWGQEVFEAGFAKVEGDAAIEIFPGALGQGLIVISTPDRVWYFLFTLDPFVLLPCHQF
jgi:hypothetical protein